MAAQTETMSQANGNLPDSRSFDQLVDALGVALSGRQREQLARYRDRLLQRNTVTNLTAVRNAAGIERRLLIESLRLVPPILSLPRLDMASRLRLVDVGTGGGIPGLVLAIAMPQAHLTLLDATGKKVAFLENVIEELELDNCVAHHGRAEEVGHDPAWRNQFDVVVARAVASLPALLELCLPLARTGGSLLLPKGADLDEELAQGERAASILGGEIRSAELLPDAGSGIDTRLVIVGKLSTTPRTYPRRAGLPARSPLGLSPPKSGRRHAS